MNLSGLVASAAREWRACAGELQRRAPAVCRVNPAVSRGILAAPFLYSLHLWRNPPWFFAFGLGHAKARPCSVGIPFVCSHLEIPVARVGSSFMGCLTSRSTRTPPALPFVLSQHFAIPAPLVASVQAGPVSFIR